MDYAVLRADIIESRPDIEIEALDRAYEFALEAHGVQKRYSGEPYIIHPVAAAGILLRLHPDLPTLQACLLHDVTEDTDVSLDQIEKEFGKEVAKLVHGMEKLGIVKLKDSDMQGEEWKRMFLALASDVRIVFIKLADRLHNMQTLQYVPEHKRRRIAKETLIVHAATASRLGIYKLKGELEDLCFKYLYPDEYEEMVEKLEEHQARSREYMDFATSQIEQLLAREGVKVEKVRGRMKHLWSIYQKMKRYGTDEISDIYDIFAVRVVLPDGGDVYSTLGVIHGEYIPLQDRFKDYIAMPKPNGYRSLHTTVVGLGGLLYDEPTEIQIRTMQMHREAEIGVASHWSYKVNRKRHFALHTALNKVQAIVEGNPDVEGLVKDWVERYQHLRPEDRAKVEKILCDFGMTQKELDDIRKGRSQENLSLQPDIDKQLAWLRGIADESAEDSDGAGVYGVNAKGAGFLGEVLGVSGAVPQMKISFYADRIFVMSPAGKIVELPRGATPVDFAYAIHTEVGNKMVHAKVNGRIVPLDYQLRNGEIVEIGTRNNAKPNRYWLSVAKTASARSKIKNWFNKQDKDSNVAAGRDMLNQQLAQMDKAQLDDKMSLLKNYGGKARSIPEREQLLESLGLGVMTTGQLVRTLFPLETRETALRERQDREIALEGLRGGVEDGFMHRELIEKVLVTGEEDLPVVLSACCKPRPPHSIIGYVTRGRTIRVHRQNCRELSGLEGERFVSAHWKASA